MVNVASVLKAIVLQLKALFLPVGIATTESTLDDQRRPDYPVCVYVFLCVIAQNTVAYTEYHFIYQWYKLDIDKTVVTLLVYKLSVMHCWHKKAKIFIILFKFFFDHENVVK